MEYKINIHAHTIFSDVVNSPYVMAVKAKELGFSALVITDHYYGQDAQFSLNKHNMSLLKNACKEARKILPVIIGLEVPFAGQEVLIFGGAAINSIIKNGKPDTEEMLRLKRITGCAVILCHPGKDFEEAAKVVDGFEQYNSGFDFFKKRGFGSLGYKQRWCNSDAHGVEALGKAYNIVDTKIENESDLIKYIKRGKQPKFFVSEINREET